MHVNIYTRGQQPMFIYSCMCITYIPALFIYSRINTLPARIEFINNNYTYLILKKILVIVYRN